MPPHDLDAEQTVLGSILLDPRALDRIRGSLLPQDFYRENHKQIYRAALNLADADPPVPIDNVTLSAELEKLGVLERIGGRAHLALIQQSVPTAANVEHYAELVKEMARKRQASAIGSQLVSDAHDPAVSAAEAIARADEAISALRPVDVDEVQEEPGPAVQFSTAVLPEQAESYAGQLVAGGLSPDFVRPAILATHTAAIGGVAWARLSESSIERAILWVLLVGRKHSGKSPAIETATLPIIEEHPRRNEQY